TRTGRFSNGNQTKVSTRVESWAQAQRGRPTLPSGCGMSAWCHKRMHSLWRCDQRDLESFVMFQKGRQYFVSSKGGEWNQFEALIGCIRQAVSTSHAVRNCRHELNRPAERPGGVIFFTIDVLFRR